VELVRSWVGKLRRPIREERRLSLFIAVFLLACEAVFCSAIIYKVPYTKIDWDAYMQQVEAFLGGERDYEAIRGDTGPLVYPAGFLYVFTALKLITGGNVLPAQILFGVLYLANMAVCFAVYIAAGSVPVWSLLLLCLSKRYHSIFMLRLFNDCFAMFFCFVAVLLYQKRRLFFATLAMSVAVSVKMNVLLMFPGMLLLLVRGLPLFQQIHSLFDFVLIQVLIALPFLAEHSASYFGKAFEFSRVFVHHWSVNLKFVPEDVFVSRELAKALLCGHLLSLFAFAHFRWCREDGGVFSVVKKWCVTSVLQVLSLLGVTIDLGKSKMLDHTRTLAPDYVADVLFGCNFVGIVFARSLHYQFYSWYFPTLPFLLFSDGGGGGGGFAFPTAVKLLLWFLVEVAFNVFPSTPLSSGMLVCCHLAILANFFLGTHPKPYDEKKKTK